MAEDLNKFLVDLSGLVPLEPKHHQFIHECLEVAARSIKYTKSLNATGAAALQKIAADHPRYQDMITAMLPADMQPPVPATAPALDWKHNPVDDEEGRPLQSVIRDTLLQPGQCVWTGGVLSKEFAGHCGAPQATPDERAQIRRELGYGPMPKDKPSLAKTQPYCTQHLRASIQPTRKATLDYDA